MSWNGFPTKVRNFLIKKLKTNLCNDNNITLHGNNENNDDSVPKIWLKLPYLGRQSGFLVKNLICKIRRSLKIHVKIIVVYQTKKTPFFLPNKARLAFLHAKLHFRLYVNSAVIPRKISNNVSLHEVLARINSKWRTNLC